MTNDHVFGLVYGREYLQCQYSVFNLTVTGSFTYTVYFNYVLTYITEI